VEYFIKFGVGIYPLYDKYFNFNSYPPIFSGMEYITNENILQGKRIVLISSYCDTKEKIDVLINTIKTVKSYNLDVMVNSPLPLPSDVINMCDFYVQTKENPLLNWPQKSVMSWARYVGKDREIVVKRSVIDYGWAALYQTKKLSEYALTYDYDRYYHIIYDTEIDDTVVSTFLLDKKCNFFPFHEHKVSLHLIALDRENLLKFSNLITFDSYLKFNCIVENWLYNTLINSDMNYKIELEKIDDLVLFHKDENLFDYSDINGLVFFIVKDVILNNDVCLYFYDNQEKINVFITVDGVETSYEISNRDIINLGFKPHNIKNVLISYNGIVSDITEKIKNITQNVIEIKLL